MDAVLIFKHNKTTTNMLAVQGSGLINFIKVIITYSLESSSIIV